MSFNPKIFAQLAEIFALKDNWNSYGSPPITDAAKAASIAIASMMLQEPHVAPVSGGGVQFDWRLGSKFLEIEVLPDGNVEALYGDEA